MREVGIKNKLMAYAGEFMAALLIIQPLLDVLSYFMLKSNTTAVTTVIRTVLLFAVVAYAFLISDNKKKYGLLFAVVGGFWLVHMLNCMRIGYADPLKDIGEYLKLVQFPLWTISFVTFLKKVEDLDLKIAGILALNFALIVFIILLSYMVGNPEYTYNYPDRDVQIGILGWFGVANTQSAIVSVLAPAVLLWAYKRENIWFFSGAAALSMALLFFTGTRLAFYAGILISAAFIVLILINRSHIVFILPLVLAVVLFILFRGSSPMAERQDLTADSYAIYQEKTDAVMGEDKDFKYKAGEEISAELLEKIKTVYLDVYSGVGVYGNPLLGDLIDRFGLERVMETYQYSIEPEVLYNVRTKRLKCVELIWAEKDLLTKLFGFEYGEIYINGNIFDPENDFPALLYYYGFLGAGMYLLFILYFIAISVIALIQNFSDFITVDFGAYATMFVLVLGSAQFSGQVLRKPSIIVYLSLAAAMIYALINVPLGRKKAVYRKKSVVLIKKI